MDKNTVLDLYNKNFGTSNENISDNQIEELSKIVSFEDVLNELSEDKLTEFSKDNNVPVKSNKEKQIKLIVHEFLER